jgi:glycerol-3-phosphate dehydrogenase (NAD(P)+)
MQGLKNIVFIGSGAISTAIGNSLAQKEKYNIYLLSIEKDVISSINKAHVNIKYFPNIRLHPALRATADKSVLEQADIIFLGIPSYAIIDYISTNKKHINKEAILVNLAKGFGKEHKTIPQSLEKILDNPVVSMKGPSFAREIINGMPTSFTIASKKDKHFDLFKEIFGYTSLYLDFSNDVIGTELASILKNIYAIIVGIVDAHFNSPNLRSLILTNAINEMKYIIYRFGGKEETMFHYCGFGDFSLTALNDMSRNRTLGLLIGKGFFTDYISEKVTLEGKVAVNIFINEILKKRFIKAKNLMMYELYRVFNEENYDLANFVNNILKKG